MIVLGAGPAGEAAVKRLAGGGLRVAVIERELVGGECAYWACVPSKTMLRPGEIRAGARRFPGLIPADETWDAVIAYRDKMISHLDDAEKAETVREHGAELIRGVAAIVRPGRIAVAGRELAYKHLVIATGTVPVIPGIDGLDRIEAWTTRELATMRSLPRDAIVLGGGPVGLETAQLLRRHGAGVTIVEGSERLLDREDPAASRELERVFAEEGIAVRLGAEAAGVEPDGDGVRVRLEDGEELVAERLIVAVGRRPRIDGLGLEEIGITPGEGGGIEVDEHCRAGEHVYAAGDVTAVMPFTHVAHYQGEIAADDILGRPRAADYAAMPRVVFTDPEVAAVGLTQEQAEERGMDVVCGTVEISTVARSGTYGAGVGGFMTVLADRHSETLVGALAVAPLAAEFIGAAVMAIQLRAPIAVIAETPMQFPTFGEALTEAVRNITL